MIRKRAPTATLPAVATTSYTLWLPNDQVEIIKSAQASSGKQWPDWVTAAIKRFKEEPQEEIESLLNTWVRNRENKTRMNVRITDACLREISALCVNSSAGSKQACLQHALYIYALSSALPPVRD
jgi:hypothetical protein